MAIYLIRHAHAGTRHAERHDVYRQLSPKGWRRADKLVGLLADVPFRALHSSPATRCVQTLEPLAAARGLEIAEWDDLWEDAEAADVLALLEREARGEGDVAVCSHGNLIPIIIEVLANQGTKVKGRGCEKGSIWVLDHDGQSFTDARYISKTTEMLLA